MLAATVAAALETAPEDVLWGLVFEQLYREHPDWHIDGWPAWNGLNPTERTAP